MSSLTDSISKITILEILIVIVALFGIILLLDVLGYQVSEDWVYIGVVIYFIYRLRYFGLEFRNDLSGIFSKISPGSLLTIVLVNVFFSYGMLYLAIAFLDYVPGADLFLSAGNSIISFGALFSTIIISPICEELLFRGVFLNRLKLIVPTTFAVLISSVLFGMLHSYGNILSAVVFGICMCMIYLKTDNILVCILAHFLNNVFAETIYFLDSGDLIFTDGIIMVVFSVLAVVSFILIVSSLHTQWKHIK